MGWRTVVSCGRRCRATGMSSKPVTATSPGTSMPCCASAYMTPSAVWSLAQTIARGSWTPAGEQAARSPGRRRRPCSCPATAGRSMNSAPARRPPRRRRAVPGDVVGAVGVAGQVGERACSRDRGSGAWRARRIAGSVVAAHVGCGRGRRLPPASRSAPCLAEPGEPASARARGRAGSARRSCGPSSTIRRCASCSSTSTEPTRRLKPRRCAATSMPRLMTSVNCRLSSSSANDAVARPPHGTGGRPRRRPP